MKTVDARSLNAFLKDPAGSVLPDRAELDGILKTYPWFTTARLVRAGKTAGSDPLAGLSMMTRPVPGYLLERPPAAGREISDEDEMIDKFLARGEYRIVPQDGTPEAETAVEPHTGDIPVSEQLAEIYLAQGLKEQAKSIYSKLSLLYPEKSVYFAGIIEKITAQNE